RCATVLERAAPVRRDKHQWHAEPARAGPRAWRETVCLRFVVLGLWPERKSPIQRGRSDLQSDFALRRDESSRRVALSFVRTSVRYAHRVSAFLNCLWLAPAARSGNSQVCQ